MAYNKIVNLLEQTEAVFNPTVGSTSGSNIYITAPFRGRLVEAGFTPRASIGSDMTLAAAIGSFITSTASLMTEVITSTLGSFNSVMMVAGNTASAQPPSPAYVNAGDIVRLTTSGGNTSLTGGTVFATFVKG